MLYGLYPGLGNRWIFYPGSSEDSTITLPYNVCASIYPLVQDIRVKIEGTFPLVLEGRSIEQSHNLQIDERRQW